VAKLLYCWHCKAERLMLDEAEWAQIVPLLSDGIAQTKAYRQRHDVSLAEVTPHG